MKHISIPSVISAFEGCKGKTLNKFWGVVAILKAINQKIIPAKPYVFGTADVSNWLEEIFRFDDTPKVYKTSAEWTIIFSSHWIEHLPELMFSSKPNIYDVATWFFRTTVFDDDITAEKLIGRFLDTLHLDKEEIEGWFSFEKKDIQFTDTHYRDSDILLTLNKAFSESQTISFETPTFIKSRPGALGQAPFVQTLYANQATQKCLILTQLDFNDYYPISDTKMETQLNKRNSLQQIFYGAPGTGKSNTIKREVDEKNLPRVRTTFHPDSDYSTFVGAYKPTSVEVPVMTIIGKEQVPVVNANPEKKIVYEFVPQAFLKAYTGAWKNQDEPFFLIIEEINRGNCAQIFGDLFQLLDRNDEGESEYPISPDEDILKFLLTDKKYGFAELTEEQKAIIPEEVRTGQLLKLPKNLHIWATMNTSDQSLFPIDSAFKRRWDWQYIPISNGRKGWQIEANGKRYDWWDFLEKMNAKIGSATNSEDKKLGYFFCKAKGGVIDAETFVGKVVFYVWNDVFKDFAEEAGELFKDEDGSLLSFNKFYTVGLLGTAEVVKEKVVLFLKNLGVEPVDESNLDEENDKDDSIIQNDNQSGNLLVELDGVIIQEKKAIDTFVKVIEKIKPARIAPLGLKVGRAKYDLLSLNRLPADTEGGYGAILRQIDGYWMLTKYSNVQKVNYLQKIAEELKLNLKARLV